MVAFVGPPPWCPEPDPDGVFETSAATVVGEGVVPGLVGVVVVGGAGGKKSPEGASGAGGVLGSEVKSGAGGGGGDGGGVHSMGKRG
ncbi:Os03g0204200 [Oryza sativa Japonica Group]|uniref:Os03g0204200 protein n=1 Tax=Oryza sativa subsp. japonica TaxID=39947 RepID=A0A0P0VUB6_ORYSJ|nr:Os03g0204200 [Oryza sativa Japonica Group]